MGAVALLAVVLPMILIQKGIERTEPVIASILLSLTPGVTLAFEMIEGRLEIPVHSILGAVACCAFATYGVRARAGASASTA